MHSGTFALILLPCPTPPEIHGSILEGNGQTVPELLLLAGVSDINLLTGSIIIVDAVSVFSDIVNIDLFLFATGGFFPADADAFEIVE